MLLAALYATFMMVVGVLLFVSFWDIFPAFAISCAVVDVLLIAAGMMEILK